MGVRGLGVWGFRGFRGLGGLGFRGLGFSGFRGLGYEGLLKSVKNPVRSRRTPQNPIKPICSLTSTLNPKP